MDIIFINFTISYFLHEQSTSFHEDLQKFCIMYLHVEVLFTRLRFGTKNDLYILCYHLGEKNSHLNEKLCDTNVTKMRDHHKSNTTLTVDITDT